MDSNEELRRLFAEARKQGISRMELEGMLEDELGLPADAQYRAEFRTGKVLSGVNQGHIAKAIRHLVKVLKNHVDTSNATEAKKLAKETKLQAQRLSQEKPGSREALAAELVDMRARGAYLREKVTR